jgi:cytochrome P450
VADTLGGDTTATALTWMSYHLTKDHNLASELYKELSAYKTIDDLNASELEKLPLLNAFIYESLRIYPPAPIPAGRICPPEGVTIRGCFIPGGVPNL